jgi:putative glutamine amidotransferase
MAQPTIGLTLDHELGGGYSQFPWYAIRENYCGAIRAAGGLPILLPHDPEAAADYLDRIDGLVVTGGGFDVGYMERTSNFPITEADGIRLILHLSLNL